MREMIGGDWKSKFAGAKETIAGAVKCAGMSQFPEFATYRQRCNKTLEALLHELMESRVQFKVSRDQRLYSFRMSLDILALEYITFYTTAILPYDYSQDNER